MSLMLQILLIRAILLIKVLNANSSCIGRFFFSSPFDGFVNNFIHVWNENMLYTGMNRAFLFISKVSKPFKATKEMHPSTI
jgi:hypothetical protein